MGTLQELDVEIRKCDLCQDVLERWPESPPHSNASVRPHPVLSKPILAPIMLVGQAPGLTEYQSGKPFSGGAGDGVRALFAECGLPPEQFDVLVYQTSAVKCFPGRRQNKERWEDRAPCTTMTKRCRPFLKQQIAIISPRVIVSLGFFAANAISSITNLPKRALKDLVGKVDRFGDISIPYLPHTSGSSMFLNTQCNKINYRVAQNKLSIEIERILEGSQSV